MGKCWWMVMGLLGVTGCAAIESATRSTTDYLFGSPAGEQAINTATGAVAALPAPWNAVATGLLGALVGVGGYLYRRRLLKADPSKID